MRFNHKLILQNRAILYFIFLIILLQIITYLNIGNYEFIFLLFLSGFIISIFNKNMIIILSGALIITHLVKQILSYRVREGIDDTTTPSPSTVSMSSTDIKAAIQVQEDKKKELQNEINNIYLNNKKEIANLNVLLSEAQAEAASIPDT